MERFNPYLRHSFYNPLSSRLKQARGVLDKATANLEVRRWLGEVANHRVHATTGRRPAEVLIEERESLQPLARPYPGRVLGSTLAAAPQAPAAKTHEPHLLQHPLSVYEVLLPEGSRCTGNKNALRRPVPLWP